jgi:anti-sigma regulatory factor (Ser/Thr protein kinase)
LSRSEAVFVIRDEGPGFDIASLPDPTSPECLELPHGRGLMLMRTFMNEVSYNATGNEVRLVKRATRDDSDVEPLVGVDAN